MHGVQPGLGEYRGMCSSSSSSIAGRCVLARPGDWFVEAVRSWVESNLDYVSGVGVGHVYQRQLLLPLCTRQGARLTTGGLLGVCVEGAGRGPGLGRASDVMCEWGACLVRAVGNLVGRQWGAEGRAGRSALGRVTVSRP